MLDENKKDWTKWINEKRYNVKENVNEFGKRIKKG